MGVLWTESFQPYATLGDGDASIRGNWSPTLHSSGFNAAFSSGPFEGDRAITVTGGSTASRGYLVRGIGFQSTHGFGMAVRRRTGLLDTGINQSIVIFSGSQAIGGLRFRDDGSLLYGNIASGDIVSLESTRTVAPAGSFPQMVWTYLEFGITHDNTNGRIFTRIEGGDTPTYDVSGIDTIGSGLVTNLVATGLGIGTYPNGGGDQVDMDFANIYTVNTVEPLGPARCSLIKPTADEIKQFAPSSGTDNFAMVGEAPTSVADYVSANALGTTDVYALEDIVGNPTILAVQPVAMALKTDAGKRDLALQLRSGATVSDGTAIPLTGGTTSVPLVRTALELDPDTGLPWTADAVRALRAGQKIAA